MRGEHRERAPGGAPGSWPSAAAGSGESETQRSLWNSADWLPVPAGSGGRSLGEEQRKNELGAETGRRLVTEKVLRKRTELGRFHLATAFLRKEDLDALICLKCRRFHPLPCASLCPYNPGSRPRGSSDYSDNCLLKAVIVLLGFSLFLTKIDGEQPKRRAVSRSLTPSGKFRTCECPVNVRLS